MQWNTSEHDWLEGRGEELYRIAMIDEATSRRFARFVRSDSTEPEILRPTPIGHSVEFSLRASISMALPRGRFGHPIKYC